MLWLSGIVPRSSSACLSAVLTAPRRCAVRVRCGRAGGFGAGGDGQRHPERGNADRCRARVCRQGNQRKPVALCPLRLARLRAPSGSTLWPCRRAAAVWLHAPVFVPLVEQAASQLHGLRHGLGRVADACARPQVASKDLTSLDGLAVLAAAEKASGSQGLAGSWAAQVWAALGGYGATVASEEAALGRTEVRLHTRARRIARRGRFGTLESVSERFGNSSHVAWLPLQNRTLLNGGEPCFDECHSRGGACPFCGQGSCCRCVRRARGSVCVCACVGGACVGKPVAALA